MPVLRTFSWVANTDPDPVLGYKLYAGTSTGNYDDANSPHDFGLVLSGVFTPAHDSTRFYALTAYNATEESEKGTEVEWIHPHTVFFA
jgi:hypothetical protein